MAFELNVPDIGEGLTEAEIVEWLVPVGATVAANEPIVSVETAKAIVEISAPRAGMLLHQGGAAGTVMDVGQLLAVIGDEGETWEQPAASAGSEQVGQAQAVAAAAAAPVTGQVRAVPLVRKLAKNLGVDLTTIVGTGPNGHITRADVEAAATTPGDVQQVTPGDASDGGTVVPLSATRKAIARNMTKSWEEIPHVSVWGPADGTRLLAARTTGGGPLEAYVVRALIPALREFPDFNARFDGTELRRSADINMGIAMDTPAGLVVPVLKNAAARTPGDLAAELERLVTAAQNRTLTLDDFAGNTFTLSNVGAVGGGYGTPIIPHGTTAILSVGRAKDDVVVRDNAIAIAPVSPVSLSFDHRVIDGASASQFLNRVVELLERFAS
jgi:pyruvate/2-oxoglutarate dehydrogenase complex dihydrolipoamide acyltransferase (E2) component